MTPRIPSIRKSLLFHTSQRARIEWVKYQAMIFTALDKVTLTVIQVRYKAMTFCALDKEYQLVRSSLTHHVIGVVSGLNKTRTS